MEEIRWCVAMFRLAPSFLGRRTVDVKSDPPVVPPKGDTRLGVTGASGGQLPQRQDCPAQALKMVGQSAETRLSVSHSCNTSTMRSPAALHLRWQPDQAGQSVPISAAAKEGIPLSPGVGLDVAVDALARLADGFARPGWGEGDVAFWRKTHLDLYAPAQALARAHRVVAATVGEPWLQEAILKEAVQLEELPSSQMLDNMATQDAATWRRHARELSELASWSGTNVKSFVLRSPEGTARTPVPVDALLACCAAMAHSLRQGGHGGAAYWEKTNRDFIDIAFSLGEGVALLAKGLPEPHRSELQAISALLERVYTVDHHHNGAEIAHDMRGRIEDVATRLDALIPRLRG